MNAELIGRVENSYDPKTEPVNGSANPSGLKLEAGRCSRNRHVNPESRFSVNH